jgi:hypothetical protein
LKKITKIRRKQEARWPGGPSEPTKEQFCLKYTVITILYLEIDEFIYLPQAPTLSHMHIDIFFYIQYIYICQKTCSGFLVEEKQEDIILKLVPLESQ